MNKKLLATLAVGLLAGPLAAQAVPYHIALTQDGVGDAGADWFGTFEAPDTGGVVTSFSAVVGGITYSYVDWPILGLFYHGPSALFTDLLNGIAAPLAFQPVVSTTVLQFDARNINGSPVGRWGLSPCTSFIGGSVCGGGSFLGTYTVTPFAVPEPGTLALFGLGFVGLGLARRRRDSMMRS
jgi:hypothetical protein